MTTELNDNITRTDLTLRIYIYNVKNFSEKKKRAAKGDGNSMTLRLWNGKSIGLLSWSKLLQDLKYGTKVAAKVPIEEEQWPNRC